jgi:hypothetical protein
MQTLPYWIQVLQALATPAIALLAIVIGMMQWRTAHQRAVLDLFDKRWTVLAELRSAIYHAITREAGIVGGEVSREYWLALNRAVFLFGPEVTECLKSIHEAIDRLYVARQQLDANGDEKAIDQRDRAMTEISDFFKRINELVAPYMRMHQKAPRFPWLD